MINPNLGLILLFEGDHRKLNVTIKNVTTFSAVSAKLMNGDSDVSSTYITSTITSRGNNILTDDIGGKASMVAGNYRYFITGTYGGKTGTWFFDVLVVPLDDSLLHNLPDTDYVPLVEEFTVFEGDNPLKSLTIPGVTFSAVAGVLKLGTTDVTATYCSGAANYSGDTLSSHYMGGTATIPAGEYAYYLTGTYNNSQAKSTWYYRIKVLAKQSII